MRFTGKTLTCSYYGAVFTFDLEKQTFPPMPSCTNYDALRVIHCTERIDCGTDTVAPFKFKDERSVYCSKYYNSVRSAS